MRTLTCDPNVEVYGQNLRAFIDNIQGDEIQPILKKNHLTDIQPDQWYPTLPWLETLNELGKSGNASANMIAIGMQIGTIVPLPNNFTLQDALTGWDASYRSLHRNGEIGKIGCEQVTPTHYKTIHTDLYPDDFCYGLAYGYARRLCPKGKTFKVYYEPDAPRRDEGGASTTVIHVTWG